MGIWIGMKVTDTSSAARVAVNPGSAGRLRWTVVSTVAGSVARARASMPATAIAPRDSSVISASLSTPIRATARTTDARASAGRTVKMTTIKRSGVKGAGSRAHHESGNIAANGSSVVGRVRTAPNKAVRNHVPCARLRATATKEVTGTKVLAATGVKARVAVKVLVAAAPGGRSNPETGVGR